MPPPNEGLDSDRATVGEREDRLVMDREITLLDRTLQLTLEVESLERVGVHRLLEHDDAVLPLVLGHVLRGIGVAEQGLGTRRGDALDGDPDAGPEPYASLVDRERLREEGHDALSRRECVRGRRHLLDEDCKLIPAEAGHRIA